MAGKVVLGSEPTMAPRCLSAGAASLGEVHPVEEATADLDEEQPRVGSGLGAFPRLSWPCSHQHWVIHRLFI